MAKIPTNPGLWTDIKRKARGTSRGTPPGRWSAAKQALALREYEKRGGSFVRQGNINEELRNKGSARKRLRIPFGNTN